MLIIWGYFLKVLILVWQQNPEYKFKSPSFLLALLRAQVICNSSQLSRQNHRLLETLKFSSEANSHLRQYHAQAGLAYLRGFLLAPRRQQNSTAHRMPLRRRFIKVPLAKRMSAREQDAVSRLTSSLNSHGVLDLCVCVLCKRSVAKILIACPLLRLTYTVLSFLFTQSWDSKAQKHKRGEPVLISLPLDLNDSMKTESKRNYNSSSHYCKYFRKHPLKLTARRLFLLHPLPHRHWHRRMITVVSFWTIWVSN